jgi:hypothetical protein
MTHDRTYFRMLSDTALAEAARYCDNDLALVLGERLATLTDAQEKLEQLQILYDRLVAENNALRDDMANDGAVSRSSPFPFHLIIGGLIMTYEHIAIVSLLALQAATLFILYDTHKAGEWFRKAWLRDSAELLYWKRNATLRHP